MRKTIVLTQQVHSIANLLRHPTLEQLHDTSLGSRSSLRNIMDCTCPTVFVSIITRTVDCVSCGRCWTLAWICLDLQTALSQCHPSTYRYLLIRYRACGLCIVESLTCASLLSFAWKKRIFLVALVRLEW
jgi:hypothetical protein